jgi:hypothetical protein
MQIAPGTAVRVASLLDLIRIAEASLDTGARASVLALWATLEARRRQAPDMTTVPAHNIGGLHRLK